MGSVIVVFLLFFCQAEEKTKTTNTSIEAQARELVSNSSLSFTLAGDDDRYLNYITEKLMAQPACKSQPNCPSKLDSIRKKLAAQRLVQKSSLDQIALLIQKKFTAAEIEYLNNWHKHKLKKKFDDFTSSPEVILITKKQKNVISNIEQEAIKEKLNVDFSQFRKGQK